MIKVKDIQFVACNLYLAMKKFKGKKVFKEYAKFYKPLDVMRKELEDEKIQKLKERLRKKELRNWNLERADKKEAKLQAKKKAKKQQKKDNKK